MLQKVCMPGDLAATPRCPPLRPSALPQDVVRRYKEMHDGWDEFPDKVAFQMNDTHPTLLGKEGRFEQAALLCVLPRCLLIAHTHADASSEQAMRPICWLCTIGRPRTCPASLALSQCPS